MSPITCDSTGLEGRKKSRTLALLMIASIFNVCMDWPFKLRFLYEYFARFHCLKMDGACPCRATIRGDDITNAFCDNAPF